MKNKLNKKLKRDKNNKQNPLKRFWNYIWYDDSLMSYVLNLLVAFVFIKFILFPSIGFVLNTNYPIVAIVSGSMQHKIVDHRVCDKYIVSTENANLNYDEWWKLCGDYYIKNFKIEKDNFSNFVYTNGLDIGDVMILYGKSPDKIKVGDILIFEPQNKNFFINYGPVIHRVVKKWEDENGKWHFQTKGDYNRESGKNFEDNITEDKVIGTPILRIRYIGYLKLYMYKIYSFITSK